MSQLTCAPSCLGHSRRRRCRLGCGSGGDGSVPSGAFRNMILVVGGTRGRRLLGPTCGSGRWDGRTEVQRALSLWPLSCLGPVPERLAVRRGMSHRNAIHPCSGAMLRQCRRQHSSVFVPRISALPCCSRPQFTRVASVTTPTRQHPKSRNSTRMYLEVAAPLPRRRHCRQTTAPKLRRSLDCGVLAASLEKWQGPRACPRW